MGKLTPEQLKQRRRKIFLNEITPEWVKYQTKCYAIDDEFDEESTSLIKRTKDKAYVVDARITLDHFNVALNVSLEAEDSVTLAGFILEHLDALPTENATFFVGTCEFTVVKMDGNRIEEVQVRKLTEEEIKEKEGGTTPKLEVQSDEENL